MHANPYLIHGPALISFSGGRTSGYMLKQILDAHGGTLPPDVHVTFANTGKEMPATLDFVQACSAQWSVEIVWLEWRDKEKTGQSFEIVNHNSASRNGEPFSALNEKKKYLPNPVTRFCTSELKIRVMRDFARTLGWVNWSNIVGLRADEPARVAKSRGRGNKDPWETETPLATAGVTKREVVAFWQSQVFDLQLANIKGDTPLGNCDVCFMKSDAKRFGIVRDHPELAEWWIEEERKADARMVPVERNGQMVLNKTGARFHMGKWSYEEMAARTRSQGDLIKLLDDESLPCGCHD